MKIKKTKKRKVIKEEFLRTPAISDLAPNKAHHCNYNK